MDLLNGFPMRYGGEILFSWFMGCLSFEYDKLIQ